MKKLINKITNRDQIVKIKKELKNLDKLDILEKKLNDITNRINTSSTKINDISTRLYKTTHASIDAYTKAYDTDRNIKNLEKLLLKKERGLNKTERNPRIIVSMTSFPARINYVDVAIERLFLQTLRPDKVILYLSKDQFPNLEKDLPYTLLDMKEIGLEIQWCDGDIKAYKKVLPVLKEYPNDIVIIVDDDLIYDVDLVENLYRGYLEYPNAIIASRVHKPTFNENGDLESYRSWKMEYFGEMYKPCHDLFFTGGAGTLIPPHAYDEEVFNEEIIKELCPHADDIWLNIQAAIKCIPIVNIAKNNIVSKVDESQAVQLYDINRDANDTQLDALRSYYKDQLVNTIYEVK